VRFSGARGWTVGAALALATACGGEAVRSADADAPAVSAASAAPASEPSSAASRRGSSDRTPTIPGLRATGGRVPRVHEVRDYRRSGDRAYWKAGRGEPRWTPEDVVRLLREDRAYVVDMGIWTGRPTGHDDQREVGRVVNEAQALARAAGVDSGRLGFHFRIDVSAKHDPRHGRCGDHCGWSGIRDDPFDPAWIMTVPRSEHRWALENRWGGDPTKDPWGEDADDQWPSFLDRDAMSVANTAERVGALYGGVSDRDPSPVRRDLHFRVSGLVMDLRNPAFRAWNARRIVADLRVYGIDPGEGAVLLVAYKPGWHAHYTGGPKPQQSCYVPGSHMWMGPAGPCPRRPQPVAGPFHRTAYGPGEFEAAVSAMLRELRAALVAAGNPDVGIVTVERPTFWRKWSMLEPALHRAPWILGELGDACYRRDVGRTGPCPLP